MAYDIDGGVGRERAIFRDNLAIGAGVVGLVGGIVGEVVTHGEVPLLARAACVAAIILGVIRAVDRMDGVFFPYEDRR